MVKLKLLMFLMLLSFAVKAQEYKYHPIFIYNFSKYIEWPSSEGDFIISVVGNSSAYEEMVNISEKKKMIKNQNLVVKKYNSLAEVGKSNIVFVTKNKDVSEEDIQRLSSQGVLVITEHEDMAEKGAHINFIATQDSRIGFELNTTMTQQSGLKVASSLAGLAAKTY